MAEPLAHIHSIVPLVTPFSNGGTVISERIARLIRRQKSAGVDAVYLCGPTGEGDTLSGHEREELLAVASRTARDVDISLLVDISAPSTARSIAHAEAAAAIGVDAVILALPGSRSYDPATCNGALAHVRECVDVPMLIRTPLGSSSLTLDIVSQTAYRNGIEGCIVGDLEDALRIQNETPITVWAQADYLMGPALLAGLPGVVSPMGNIAPERLSELVRAARMGNIDDVRRLQRWFMGLCDLIGGDVTIPRIKAALEIVGVPSGVCRLPARELLPTERETLAAALRQWGLS